MVRPMRSGAMAEKTMPSKVTNEVTTAPGDGRHSATHSDSGIRLACGNPTQCDAI